MEGHIADTGSPTDTWFHGSERPPEVSKTKSPPLRGSQVTPPICGANTYLIVDVEGVVEYKSLPSGLHNVTEDLV